MKTKVLLSAIATIALLMPSTAVASNNKHRHEAKPKARIEHRMHVAHRPAVGKRFSHRPVNGKTITSVHASMSIASDDGAPRVGSGAQIFSVGA